MAEIVQLSKNEKLDTPSMRQPLDFYRSSTHDGSDYYSPTSTSWNKVHLDYHIRNLPSQDDLRALLACNQQSKPYSATHSHMGR